MKNNVFYFLGKILFLIAFSMFIASPAFGGDRVPAGTTLEEESYVFTVDEAEEIMHTIQSLESKVEQQEEQILLLKEIDTVNEEQEEELEELLKIREEQIILYKEWQAADAERIKTLERQEKITQLERWGFFALGIVVASGAIIAADRLDDSVIENN